MNRAAASDTIAAIATPPGRGAVGILRLSGPHAVEIAERMAGPLPAARTHALRAFRDSADAVVDQGLVLRFDAPRSYTGETVIELQGHGGAVVLDLLLRAACELGARLARPGEFSERAFLNGRLDLAQAEAVADLINASSAAAAHAAQRSLDGELSRRVAVVSEQLMALRVFVEGALDFSDEDIDWLADAGLLGRIDAVTRQLQMLLTQCARGRRLRDGLIVTLTGRPNVGKSTLMNALAGADIAIVTAIAGTTRDVLRENIDIDGLPVTLVDTAGLRESLDPVELEGIRRARLALEQAELALLVLDDREGLSIDDATILTQLPTGLPVIRIHNKCDLSGRAAEHFVDNGDVHLRLSATSGAGLSLLREAVRRHAGLDAANESLFTARTRHVDALQRTLERIRAASGHLRQGGLPELAAEELRLAQEALGEITGRVTTEDLLGQIFSSFCIGK